MSEGNIADKLVVEETNGAMRSVELVAIVGVGKWPIYDSSRLRGFPASLGSNEASTRGEPGPSPTRLALTLLQEWKWQPASQGARAES